MEGDRDRESLAEGAAGPIRATDLAVRIDDDRQLADLLDPGEQPHFALESMMLDVVRHHGGENDDRTRKMAPPDGGVYVLATDRRVLFVVSYGDDASTYEAGFEDLQSASLSALGSDRRLRFARGGTSYDVYPGDSEDLCERVVSFVNDRAGSGGDGDSDGDGDRDPLERLERLADLNERGALTDAEFEEKKRDLLDEL